MLALALLLPLGVWALYRHAERARRRAWSAYAPGVGPRLVALAPWQRGRRAAAVAAAAALLGVALARPQLPGGEQTVRREGLDLVIALDVSQSMLARDVAPSRLERARAELHRLADALPGDRLGLVLFAADAFVQCPLTTDRGAFRLFLDAASPDMLPTQGTDFEAALTAAADAFGPPVAPAPGSAPPARVVLVVSDGENHDGSLSRARDIAAEAGAVVFTAGVGEADGATIPVPQGDAVVDKVDPQTGEVVRTRLDEDALRDLAERGGYVHVGRLSSGMEDLPTRLAGLTRGSLGTTTMGTRREVYAWPLALALVLLLVEALLPDARPVPTPPSPLDAAPAAPRRRWGRRRGTAQGTRADAVRST